MNKTLILAALLAISVNASATGTPENPSKSTKITKGGSASQAQQQTQGQTQKATGGSASSTGGNSSNDGNAQSMSYSYSNNEALQRNNTPDMGSVLIHPTANCRVAYGGGVVGPGFGIQIGSSEPSEVCELIELSKQLKYLGLSDPSIQIMCQEPRAAKAMGKICPVETSVNVSGPPEIIRP